MMGAEWMVSQQSLGLGFSITRIETSEHFSRCYSGHKGEQGSRVEDHYTIRGIWSVFGPAAYASLYTLREANEHVEHNPSRAETPVLARESKSYEAE
jgi:hypothetical protein